MSRLIVRARTHQRVLGGDRRYPQARRILPLRDAGTEPVDAGRGDAHRRNPSTERGDPMRSRSWSRPADDRPHHRGFHPQVTCPVPRQDRPPLLETSVDTSSPSGTAACRSQCSDNLPSGSPRSDRPPRYRASTDDREPTRSGRLDRRIPRRPTPAQTSWVTMTDARPGLDRCRERAQQHHRTRSTDQSAWHAQQAWNVTAALGAAHARRHDSMPTIRGTGHGHNRLKAPNTIC